MFPTRVFEGHFLESKTPYFHKFVPKFSWSFCYRNAGGQTLIVTYIYIYNTDYVNTEYDIRCR